MELWRIGKSAETNQRFLVSRAWGGDGVAEDGMGATA